VFCGKGKTSNTAKNECVPDEHEWDLYFIIIGIVIFLLLAVTVVTVIRSNHFVAAAAAAAAEQDDLQQRLLTQLDDATNPLEMDHFIIDPKDLRLHFQIGAGGMGSVYKATYGERTEVAAKEVHCFDESEFEKEVRNLCSLHHPNILRVFGVCTKPAEMCNDGREHKYIVTGTFLWILS